jgi:aspartate/methionine/tyrosine aminotransferase
MTRHETHVRYDIAESGILPLTTNDLLDFEPPDGRAAALERLLALPLGYSEARGTEELRGRLAATYARGDADHILVTTGAIEANFLLFNVLLDAGDHVIAPYPAYQQLYSVPRAIGGSSRRARKSSSSIRRTTRRVPCCRRPRPSACMRWRSQSARP